MTFLKFQEQIEILKNVIGNKERAVQERALSLFLDRSFLNFLLHFSILLLAILNIASQLNCKAIFHNFKESIANLVGNQERTYQ